MRREKAQGVGLKHCRVDGFAGAFVALRFVRTSTSQPSQGWSLIPVQPLANCCILQAEPSLDSTWTALVCEGNPLDATSGFLRLQEQCLAPT